jgi:hypothetical protein
MQSFKQYVTEYTDETLTYDIDRLGIMFTEKFKPNQKLINTILDTLYETNDADAEDDLETQLKCEIDRFEIVVETAMTMAPVQTPRGKLENIVMWLANNGTNPENGLAGNGKKRYDMIMKKLER